MVKDRILVIGTADPAPWHPLSAVEGELNLLLADLGEWEATVDPDRLTALEKDSVRLLVCYADLWEGALTDAQTAGLIRFVAGGGRILVLHNGISYQGRSEFRAVVGAQFTGHPPATSLSFRSCRPEHPVCRGLPSEWTMDEEPYRFQFHGADTTVIYEYQHEGVWYPAAWTAGFGQGTMVYLMPGHTVASFRHPSYRELVCSAARWLLESEGNS